MIDPNRHFESTGRAPSRSSAVAIKRAKIASRRTDARDGGRRVATWLPLILLAGVVVAGCQPATLPETDSARREMWEVFVTEGARIGHAHTVYESVASPEGDRVRIVSESEMTLRRFDQVVETNIRLESIETPEGRLIAFESVLATPPVEMITTGRTAEDQLVIEQQTLGKTQNSRIAWDPAWGGFFAQEQSLRAQPMQPGETRNLRALTPVFNQPGDVHLQARDYETTQLLDGPAELLRIDVRVQLGATPIESVVWTDRAGETQKTLVKAQGWETFRTTKAMALERRGAAEFDLGQSSLVKVSRPLAQPHQTQRIVYHARLRNGDAAARFVSGPTQSVKRIDDETAEIVVQALRPENAAAAFGPSTQPADADRSPNGLIQSDDSRIVAMARQVAPDETDPWTVARALERHVRDVVRVTSFSQAIASAADVAQSLEGDCTEHAMLMAALCRARDIPARVAIGLVYYGQAGGFAYHMWTEVWIDGHWIPLDATLGRGGIGAAHLKISESNLEGVSPYAALLPVLNLLGQLELEIVQVESGG